MAVGARYLPHLVSYVGVATAPPQLPTFLCVATTNVNESQFDFHISFASLPFPSLSPPTFCNFLLLFA